MGDQIFPFLLQQGSPTSLSLVLAGGSGPLRGTEAFEVVETLQARPTILAGAARALPNLCGKSRHIPCYLLLGSKAQECCTHQDALVPYSTS